MDQGRVLEILKDVGAVITNSHLVYTSGKHGSAYVNKDAIYPHTWETSQLCAALAAAFANDGVEVVIAPAVGAVILSQWTATHLGRLLGRDVLCTYADKVAIAIPDPEGKGRKCFVETGNFVVKRGYDKLVAGKQVLVVEDILTTGGSARKVIETVRALGGYVVGLGVLCNRGGVTERDLANIPKLVALANVKLDMWDEDACPLCKWGVPINTDVGKGREFLARKQSA